MKTWSLRLPCVSAAAVLSALSTILLPSAAASPIKDELLGFELDPAAGGVPVCMIEPPGLPDDPACAGFDVPKARQALSSRSGRTQRLGIAVLRLGEGSVIVFADVLAPGSSIGTANVEAMMLSVEKGLPRVSTDAHLVEIAPGKRYEVIRVNGLDALRYEVNLGLPAGHPNRPTGWWILYTVPGDAGDVQVSWLVAPEIIGPARQVASKVMASTRLRASQQGELGKTSTYFFGQAVYHLALAAIPLCLLGVAIVLVLRARRRRSRNMHDPPIV